MKGLGLYAVLISGIALAASFSAQSTYAKNQNTDTTNPETQKFDESAPRKDRGFQFTNIMPAAKPNIQAPLVIVKPVALPKQAVKSANLPQTNYKISKKKSSQTTKPSSVVITSTPNSPVIYASQSSVTQAVISASLDHSGQNPSYKVGDKLAVNINANTDCNVVVFNYDSHGTLTQIFPNDYQQSGFVKAGQSVQIGGAESPFDYQVSGKGGKEKIFVYAYPTGTDKPLEIALSPVSGSPFRQAEMSPEKYRELVNNSKSFFSREVKVVPKKGAQLISNVQSTSSANKVELTFTVEK